MQHRIGVFDSGVGGLTTLAKIKQFLPDEEYFYIGDHANNPYGEKTTDELIATSTNVVRHLEQHGVELVVIACNTATTRCIAELRQRFPRIQFVGTEPAIKLVHDQGFKHALLLATPNTIKSDQVSRLMKKYATERQIDLFPCDGLAKTIEDELVNLLDEPEVIWQQPHIPHNIVQSNKVAKCLDDLLENIERPMHYDAIILGCTHYVYLKPLLAQKFPQATLLDGNTGAAKRVRSLLYGDNN